jgi:hypothetical protein
LKIITWRRRVSFEGLYRTADEGISVPKLAAGLPADS